MPSRHPMILTLLLLIVASVCLNVWSWWHRHHPPKPPIQQYHRQTAALRKAIDKQHRVVP